MLLCRSMSSVMPGNYYFVLVTFVEDIGIIFFVWRNSSLGAGVEFLPKLVGCNVFNSDPILQNKIICRFFYPNIIKYHLDRLPPSWFRKKLTGLSTFAMDCVEAQSERASILTFIILMCCLDNASTTWFSLPGL